MTIIKICRVKDLHAARLCGDFGVDFIGLHCIHGIKPSNKSMYLRICQELQSYYYKTTPVVVTKVQDPEIIADISLYLNVNVIQIHAPMDPEQIEILFRKLEKRLGKRPIIIATVSVDDPFVLHRTKKLRSLADYILIDSSYKGGTGLKARKEFLLPIIQEANPVKVILAGGLNPENIREVLTTIRPYGVDIQSGIESDLPGRPKNPILLREFIEVVRKNSREYKKNDFILAKHRPLVSLAVTSVGVDKIETVLKRFERTDIDLVHIDFSDQTVAPQFLAAPYDILNKLSKLLPCLPYDIHLFIERSVNQKMILEKCLKINPLIRLALIHITNFERLSWEKLDNFVAMVDELGIGTGIAVQATGFTIDQLNLTLPHFEKYSLSEISLITRSKSHAINEVKKYDLPLLTRLTGWANDQNSQIHISLDRDMSIPKLKLFAQGRPNHLVVGTALLTATNPQRTITGMRKFLVAPQIPYEKL